MTSIFASPRAIEDTACTLRELLLDPADFDPRLGVDIGLISEAECQAIYWYYGL